jgi:hypothetical protein
MIYHCIDLKVNTLPCIIFGDEQISIKNRNIVESIYQELLTTNKKELIVNRNGNRSFALPLI